MILDKLASAIMNDIVSGLRGYHCNLSMSIDLIKDDIINTRLSLIAAYSLKGILPFKDLLTSINCINIDCKNLEKCSCTQALNSTPTAHFEIPQVVSNLGDLAIDYIGSIDKQNPFIIYTSFQSVKYYQKYRKRGKNKPYVVIDPTPNENGMLDGFVFNAPLLQQISITAIFKDPRQLENYSCCSELNDDNFNFLNEEIIDKIVKTKILYYRSAAAALRPNDQSYTTA